MTTTAGQSRPDRRRGPGHRAHGQPGRRTQLPAPTTPRCCSPGSIPGGPASWPPPWSGARTSPRGSTPWSPTSTTGPGHPRCGPWACSPTASHTCCRQRRGPISPRAATGPFSLVGNLLTNLVSLAALDGEGLQPGHPALDHPVRGPQRRAAGRRGRHRARHATGWSRSGVAADAARIAAIMGAHAARHPWSVSDSAVAAALAGDEFAGTPMVAISGPRTERLAAILAGVGGQDQIIIGVVNGPNRHILAGDRAALAHLRVGLEGLAQAEARKRSGRPAGRDPVPVRLGAARQLRALPPPEPRAVRQQDALAQIRDLGLSLPAIGDTRITDPATGHGPARRRTLREVSSSRSWPVQHDWAACRHRERSGGDSRGDGQPAGRPGAVRPPPICADGRRW